MAVRTDYALRVWAIGLACAAPALGQNLDSTVSRLAEGAARSYVAPVASGLGANLNSGWFHRAPDPVILGFHLEAGVVGMGTLYRGAQKHFSTQGSLRFDRAQAERLVDSAYQAFAQDPRSAYLTAEQKRAVRDSLVGRLTSLPFQVRISGATAVGPAKDSVRVAFAGDTIHFTLPAAGAAGPRDTSIAVPAQDIALPVGGVLPPMPFLNQSLLPLAAPQINVGTILGTDAALRWLPEVDYRDVEHIRYFGFGLQHNPGVWLPADLPVNLCGTFLAQRLRLDDSFEATALAWGLNASKTFGWRMLNIIPYGGVMYERSWMRVDYEYAVDLGPEAGVHAERIRFEVEGENRARATAGISLRLLFVNLNADFSWAEYPVASAGVMVGI